MRNQLPDDLNDMIGRMLDERSEDHERFERDREIVALMVVELERMAQHMRAVVERAKTRLAGITPDGLPPRA